MNEELIFEPQENQWILGGGICNVTFSGTEKYLIFTRSYDIFGWNKEIQKIRWKDIQKVIIHNKLFGCDIEIVVGHHRQTEIFAQGFFKPVGELIQYCWDELS